MSYLKTLNSTDVIVTPFTVHKQFSYPGGVPFYSEDNVFRVIGTKENYPLGGDEEGTGSASLIFNSIKQLYYSNYLSGSNGQVSNIGTASFNPDGTITGPAYTPNYINNIQSNNEIRIFSFGENDDIHVLSIPQKLFGDYIKPGSFTNSTSKDDGQGNHIVESTHIGNIIYAAGLIIYSGSSTNPWSSNIQWESSYTIYETQYKCTIRANEYNYSLNPSLLQSGSTELYKDFVTGSDFSPYVTTIGLYNENQELLAVAKLAQPLPTSQTTDTTILINLDR